MLNRCFFVITVSHYSTLCVWHCCNAILSNQHPELQIYILNTVIHQLSRFTFQFQIHMYECALQNFPSIGLITERLSLIKHSSSLFATATVLDFSYCIFCALGGPWTALQTGCINVRVVSERLLILEGDKEQEPTAELNNQEPLCSAGDRSGGHSLQREVSDCLRCTLY